MIELQVVGGGKMGEALLAGLVAAAWAKPDALAVIEPVATRRKVLAERFPGVEVAAAPVEAKAAVLAVKPGSIAEVAGLLAGTGATRVLSIAAGIKLATLEAALPAGVVAIRAMPNTPSLVGAGAAAISPGTGATDDDVAWAESILGAVGIVVRVPEAQLDAVTGLSGSGPAYVFLVAEALIEAGVLMGLSRDVSQALATQTLLGSARLLAESGDTAETLRAAVTSPGGTTAAGLRALEQAGVRAAFLDAVEAAVRRSREMG